MKDKKTIMPKTIASCLTDDYYFLDDFPYVEDKSITLAITQYNNED